LMKIAIKSNVKNVIGVQIILKQGSRTQERIKP